MDGSKIDEVIRSSKVVVHSGRYAYLKTKEKDLKNHFLVSQDEDEITVVTEENNVSDVKYEEIVKWFKLIEIKVSVPFLARFIARVSNIIAAKGCNTLVVSTFSKDYILTREENIDDAVAALRDEGFEVEE